MKVFNTYLSSAIQSFILLHGIGITILIWNMAYASNQEYMLLGEWPFFARCYLYNGNCSIMVFTSFFTCARVASFS